MKGLFYASMAAFVLYGLWGVVAVLVFAPIAFALALGEAIFRGLM